MRGAMETHIGTQVITINKMRQPRSDGILEKRKQKKRLRKELKEADEKGDPNRNTIRTQYIEAQKNLRNEIEVHNQSRIRSTTDKIIREGGVKSNTFWNIRKSILQHNKKDDYNPGGGTPHIFRYGGSARGLKPIRYIYLRKPEFRTHLYTRRAQSPFIGKISYKK